MNIGFEALGVDVFACFGLAGGSVGWVGFCCSFVFLHDLSLFRFKRRGEINHEQTLEGHLRIEKNTRNRQKRLPEKTPSTPGMSSAITAHLWPLSYRAVCFFSSDSYAEGIEGMTFISKIIFISFSLFFVLRSTVFSSAFSFSFFPPAVEVGYS